MASDNIDPPNAAEWEKNPDLAGRKYVLAVAAELFGADARKLEIGESAFGDFSLTGPTEMVDRLTKELALRKASGQKGPDRSA